MRGPPQTMSQALLQGMSNIMKNYPGHNIKHFFGSDPMWAGEFFVLHAQLVFEEEQIKREANKKTRG
ncbi:MAG: hypothetical protein Q8O88_01335 [bacterium]|nr:hypothetical protein [bacterium]